MGKAWSNLAKVVYRRTYARKDSGVLENWDQTVERYVAGNVRGLNVPESEIKELIRFGKQRKAIPAGRGLWFSGTDANYRLGAVAECNCFFLTADDWHKWVVAQDLLMLGGGVGLSVEHRFVSKLPKVKKGVEIVNKDTKDADLIVSDSREGWCELTRRVLESFFVSGRSFSYSTVCVRSYGEPIRGFGGTASGPGPLRDFVTNLTSILTPREGKHIRPIDAMDIICCIGQMVVAGNVRRSAIIILGDPFDKEYLKAKRWSLGNIPTWRAFANLSVVAEDADDLTPLFWKTYEDGEPFGVINRVAIQKFARIGELKKDVATGVNPCAEATLEDYGVCNLQDIALPNLESEEEFTKAARLMHRYGKRVTMHSFHNKNIDEVVKKSRRIGTGITGCLASPLFNPETLNRAFTAIQDENVAYSKELGIPESIRTTVIKPSGTVSKVLDMEGYEGIHPSYSRFIIQRVRFAANDPLIPKLRAAGHYMEPVRRFDGSNDLGTLVVDFYVKAPEGYPVADEDWNLQKQLDAVMMANKYWSDQSTSCTVYYKREDLDYLKEWMANNLANLKTISFLLHSSHGFDQAPKEAVSKERFEKLSAKIKPIAFEDIEEGDMESMECANGVCPIK